MANKKALQQEFSKRQARIKLNLENINKAWLEIAYDLYWIKQNKCYAPNYKSIQDYAEKELRLTRTSMQNLIRIIDVYATRDSNGDIDMTKPSLRDNYAQFTKSQLTEMAAMTEEERSKITPDTSVRQIHQIRYPNKGERIGADVKYDRDAQAWLKKQRNKSASIRDAIHTAIELYGLKDLHAMSEEDKEPHILTVAGKQKYRFTCRPIAMEARDYLMKHCGVKANDINITPDKDINILRTNKGVVKF